MTEATEIVLMDEEPAPAKPLTVIPSDNSPMARVMAALDRGITPEQIGQMLVVQEAWERREAEKAYNEGMAAFSAEAIKIIKRKEVDFQTAKGRTHYWHAELSDVVEAVKPVLAKHGFSYRWDTKQDRDWLDVTCILKHRLGHFEVCTMGGPPDESGGKNRIQGFKSTKSYLERQTLEAICGVAEKGVDDDGAGGAREALVDTWLKQAKEAQSYEETNRLMRDGSDVFTKAKDVEGYRTFAAAIQARRNELRKKETVHG